MKRGLLLLLVVLALGACRRPTAPGPGWTYTGDFHKAISTANCIAVRDGGFHTKNEIQKQKTLCLITDPAEVRLVAENLKFQEEQTTPSCECVGYPGMDWYCGRECIAVTSVQHCRALRWKGFKTDAVLTPASAAWLKTWLMEHKVQEESLK